MAKSDEGGGERDCMTPFQRIRHASVMGKGCSLDAEEVQELVSKNRGILQRAYQDDLAEYEPGDAENVDAPADN